MNYAVLVAGASKPKEKIMDDEWLLLRCQCGELAFLEFGILYDLEEDTLYYVMFAQEPATFWDKLKMLLKRERYARDILLAKSQMEKIKDMLEKHLGDGG